MPPLAAAAASEDFIGAIQNALLAAGMLSDQIVVLDPNTEATTPYDPETDTGGDATPTKLIGPRAAYVKAVGAELVLESGLQQGMLRYQVQFIPEPGDPIIPKGSIIRVLEGGKNPALPHFAFAVLGVPTGSIAALTKVECLTSSTPSAPWVEP